eukprot:TRINITY_DN7839_c0_g1_i3.p3 TRINITY_DN7839_c0_g1~~TRINITY_DN7839_c0_g1_i3.p3  ORF type:complete len:100 (-),score=26.66 TRINITY_DN7839_c0_g1_i3:218-517(-)
MGLYHKSNMVCAAITPIALMVPNLPCDVVLSVVFPMHAYVGLHTVVSDYVPSAFEGLGRAAVIAATGITIVGLQINNFTGDGLTRSTLKMWKGEKKEEK